MDRANQALDFDNGDSLFGCLEMLESRDYKYCSMEVFRETNVDMAGVIFGAVLYPVALLSIASGNGGELFTKTEIDSQAVYNIGAYLESELATRRANIKKALATYNHQLLKPNSTYFLNLTTKQEIERAIQGVKTVAQLEQMQSIMASLKSNEKVISTAKLNVRKDTSSRSKIMGKLKGGQTITPKSHKDGWYQVDDGWISDKYAKDIKEGYLAKLKLRGNKLHFANQSQTLLAGNNVSSKEINKVLNNKSALKGVSAAKIAKLKTLKAQAIEREKFTLANNTHSLVAFNTFLNIYPSGEYANKAILLREPLWLQQAKDQDTAKAYRDFLNAYPKSQYYSQVRDSWLALASKQNTVVAYKKFLEGYPVASQETKVHALWFDLIKSQNTISGYRDFLKGGTNSDFEKQASLLLEPLWYNKIAASGAYSDLSGFLYELPNSKHNTKISYAHNNCQRVARDFFTTSDKCVVNYLKLDNIRKQKTFQSYAKAYALSGKESDFNLAQKLASSRADKQIIEYFAVLALKDKSRLFDVDITDQHQFLGNAKHSTWFAQAKGSSKAKIQGKMTLALKNDAPFEIKYGNYDIQTQLNLKAYYAKEVRSNWVGNSNTNPVENEKIDVGFSLSANKKVDTQKYNFGTYTIAYKDTGMMGGYTASYLEREIEFSAYISSITPSYRLNVF
jgi:hypothetical protein